jgi:ApbE superfamily uncharacterized protein (UPF0280 family)
MLECLSPKSFTLNQLGQRKGLTRKTYQIGVSKGVIITNYPPAIKTAIESIHESRKYLDKFVKLHPLFKLSFGPVKVKESKLITQLMSSAAKKAGVGPMAAVAGVIADCAAKKMIEHGATIAVVENGGEAALHSDRPLVVSIGSGDNIISNRFGFKFTEFPCGVATSSGRHSHAFSMGDADSVTVIADNAGLADAVATASANKVVGKLGFDVKAGVEKALSIEGVRGAIAIRDQQVSLGGSLPLLLSIDGPTSSKIRVCDKR